MAFRQGHCIAKPFKEGGFRRIDHPVGMHQLRRKRESCFLLFRVESWQGLGD